MFFCEYCILLSSLLISPLFTVSENVHLSIHYTMCSHYYSLIPGLSNAQRYSLFHRRRITTIRDSVRWSIGANESYCVGETVLPDEGTLSCPWTAHLSHTALHYGPKCNLWTVLEWNQRTIQRRNLWTVLERNQRKIQKISVVDSSELKLVDSSEMKAMVCSGRKSHLRARPCSYMPECSSGCGVRTRPALHDG